MPSFASTVARTRVLSVSRLSLRSIRLSWTSMQFFRLEKARHLCIRGRSGVLSLPLLIGRIPVAWMDVVIWCRPLPFLRTCGVFRIRSHPPRLRSCPHLHVSQVPFSTLSKSRDRFTRVASRFHHEGVGGGWSWCRPGGDVAGKDTSSDVILSFLSPPLREIQSCAIQSTEGWKEDQPVVEKRTRGGLQPSPTLPRQN